MLIIRNLKGQYQRIIESERLSYFFIIIAMK